MGVLKSLRGKVSCSHQFNVVLEFGLQNNSSERCLIVSLKNFNCVVTLTGFEL